jgi:hypothetical protein
MQGGSVLVYLTKSRSPPESLPPNGSSSAPVVAQAIADLKGFGFGGVYQRDRIYSNQLYFVPDDVLSPSDAALLGIIRDDQFFGGLSPYPFISTKAITHGLIGASAVRPAGWLEIFSERIKHVVLYGYTVFHHVDARIAGQKLLSQGSLRIKNPIHAAGVGQLVVASIKELDTQLTGMHPESLDRYGMVFETNLEPVITRTVGQIRIGEHKLTYCGIQRLTEDNEGQIVYGGADLTCVYGSWEALDRVPMSNSGRLAVTQARTYDEATAEYLTLQPSRANYDIGQGVDGCGRQCSGVLEVTWRIGGASTAELAALSIFAHDPEIRMVRASAVKLFGNNQRPPPDANIHFWGVDPQFGPMIRYTTARSVNTFS